MLIFEIDDAEDQYQFEDFVPVCIEGMDESPSFAPEEDLPFVNMFKDQTETEKLQSTNISVPLVPEVNFTKLLINSQLKIQQDANASEVKCKSEPVLRPKSKRVIKSKTISDELPRCNPQRTSKTKTLQKSKEKAHDKFDESKSENDNTFGVEKATRWGREHDRMLFQLIRQLETEGILTFDELKTIQPRQAYRHKGVCLLAKRFGWKTIVRNLVSRIRNLQEKDFSVREVKLMKQIIKKDYKYKNVDYDKIIYHFPGKSLARVTEVGDNIVQGKLKKRLCGVNYSQVLGKN